MNVANLFSSLSWSPEREVIDELLKRGGIRIERIVSSGQATPPGVWYDQDSHEWVILLRGSAGLRFADREAVLTLAPGDYLDIPPHVRHRVEWTDPAQVTVWLALHYSEASNP